MRGRPSDPLPDFIDPELATLAERCRPRPHTLTAKSLCSQYVASAPKAPMRSPVRRGEGSLAAAGHSLYSVPRFGMTRGAFSTATVIDKRGQRERHSPHTARFISSATGRSAPYRSASAARSTLAR
jgi:hypothetical protein